LTRDLTDYGAVRHLRAPIPLITEGLDRTRRQLQAEVLGDPLAALSGAGWQDDAMVTPDPFDLARFVAAQDAGGSYEHAVAELRNGRKTSHWMWYVFPQLAGLGQSATSRLYAISSVEEASAYLAHPVLGSRLRACAEILTGLSGPTAEHIFGGIDAMKLRSAMTLFRHADPAEHVFARVLDQYFGGVSDPATERLLNQAAGAQGRSQHDPPGGSAGGR
jgi:uncharacterized protein (DUF1810 family)